MYDESTAMLAFNLKLMAAKTRKNVLISAGQQADKERLLPTVRKLAALGGINLYATAGTSHFLSGNGIKNQELFKIAEKKEPNIKSFLFDDRFDFVIDIMTGDIDYDETTDCKIIRALCIENGIPLITDVDVAIMTVESLEKAKSTDVFKYKIADPSRPWDMKAHFFQRVAELGGFACYHAHFDKAYLINLENLRLSQVAMQEKWELLKYQKENYTHDDLVERISRCLDTMIAQGVTHCRSNVDADNTVKLLCLEAALEVREKYRGRIHFEIGLQPLQGLLEPESRKFFTAACERVDVLGGLPSRDRPTPEKHLDYAFAIARDLGKPVDVHIDQENNPDENDTELLALKTIEYGLEGRVSGVHAISLAAKSEHEQDRIIGLIKDAGMSITVCPSAALSMQQLPKMASLHNSIAPVVKLIEAGVMVRIGVDNIYDLFQPLIDGDMWFECRALMETCRYYNLDKIAEIACDKSGFIGQS